MIDIVCNIDSSYVEHCGVMLTSLLLKNKEERFKVHIINSSLSEQDKQRLSVLSERFPVELAYYDVPHSFVESFPIQKKDHLSLATYLRIFMPELLPVEVEKVLYLDVDLIVMDSIRELWDVDIADCAVAAVEERPPYDLNMPVVLGYPVEYSYFNMGVLLINLKRWRAMNLTAQCKQFIAKNYDIIKYHDQDVLNALLYAERKFISIRWNMMHFFFFLRPEIQPRRMEDLKYALHHPSIIHFTGSRKPWLHNCDSPYRAQYLRLASENGWHVASKKENLHHSLRTFLYKLLFSLHLKKQKTLQVSDYESLYSSDWTEK